MVAELIAESGRKIGEVKDRVVYYDERNIRRGGWYEYDLFVNGRLVSTHESFLDLTLKYVGDGHFTCVSRSMMHYKQLRIAEAVKKYGLNKDDAIAETEGFAPWVYDRLYYDPDQGKWKVGE